MWSDVAVRVVRFLPEIEHLITRPIGTQLSLKSVSWLKRKLFKKYLYIYVCVFPYSTDKKKLRRKNFVCVFETLRVIWILIRAKGVREESAFPQHHHHPHSRSDLLFFFWAYKEINCGRGGRHQGISLRSSRLTTTHTSPIISSERKVRTSMYKSLSIPFLRKRKSVCLREFLWMDL